jgi:hypothetical protein
LRRLEHSLAPTCMIAMSKRRPGLATAAVAAVLGLAACGWPLINDDCRADLIIAHFDGELTLDGSRRAIAQDAPLASTNVTPDVFLQLNDVLIEGRATVDGVVWSHGGIGSASDFFAIALGAALHDGESRVVSTTFQGGGWGPFNVSRTGALVALRLDDVWAEAVQGTITVLRAAPLQVELDLELTLSGGEVVTLSGTDTFRYERGTCPDLRS